MLGAWAPNITHSGFSHGGVVGRRRACLVVESDITDTSGHSIINALMEASIRFYGNMDHPGRLPGGGDA